MKKIIQNKLIDLCFIVSCIGIIYCLYEIIEHAKEGIAFYWHILGIVSIFAIFLIHKKKYAHDFEKNTLYVFSYIHTFIHGSLILSILSKNIYLFYTALLFFIVEEFIRIWFMNYTLGYSFRNLIYIFFLSIISSILSIIYISENTDIYERYEGLGLLFYYITIPLLFIHIKRHKKHGHSHEHICNIDHDNHHKHD